ncbi:MAG: thiol reductase thioredoxin [Gammaproteobacteria bacterium]|nr:thiol reductase thioredoxin [Gammaproteobacteria bacterium]
MSSVIEVTDDTFDEQVLNSDTPVLLDFWAEWCGPCKILGPVIEEVSQEYNSKIKFAKLDIDQNPTNTQKFGIRGIPTIVLFKNGNAAATHVGVLSKSELTAFLDKNT